MGRNKKDFGSCPECYGLGETYQGNEEDASREACPSCNPTDTTTPDMQKARENASDAAWARMEAQKDE